LTDVAERRSARVPVRLIASVGLVITAGCAYEHTSGRDSVDTLREVYDARGWDSGLAYGIAMEDAQANGRDDEPDAVRMDCWMYAIKPATAAVLGIVAGLLITNHHSGPGIAVGALAVPVAFLPNCHAWIAYRRLGAAPRRGAPSSPAPVDPPVRLFHQAPAEPSGDAPDASAPSD
jgi:hypothetical protein